jgi:hypothetical protein
MNIPRMFLKDLLLYDCILEMSIEWINAEDLYNLLYWGTIEVFHFVIISDYLIVDIRSKDEYLINHVER